SLWFSDFSHFHKTLGISDMISIEREVAHRPRFEFNKPLACISLIFEDTAVALPSLDWTVRTIAWLDYDDRLNRAMLEDSRVIAGKASPGSVFIVSVQVEGPPVYTAMDDDGEETVRAAGSIQDLRDNFGAGAVPAQALDSDLKGWATAKLVRRMIKSAILDALAVRNAGRPNDQKIEFEQFAAFEYADGAKMTTVCGVFVDSGQKNLLSSCGFNDLSFYQPGDEATRLVVPILTPREMRMLEAQLPGAVSPALGGNIVPGRDADAFANLYRYLPSFASLED
ncbi:O-methyltransferase, partial [Mesorhizobium sp.]|uniref:O-methyltransferase n=1 Tax=Mesorhizobium sp. TaxID=1871066 RepID=UPI0025BB4782